MAAERSTSHSLELIFIQEAGASASGDNICVVENAN